jgi:hypothetical protein
MHVQVISSLNKRQITIKENKTCQFLYLTIRIQDIV